MALLVTVARYQTLTGDTATAASAASAAIEDATAMLAETLGRPQALKSESRTETMNVGRNGDLRPLAVPVTAVTGYDSFTTHTIYGASADATIPLGLLGTDVPSTVEITYTGGWLERIAAGSVPNALPAYMERDIAVAAYQILRPGTMLAVPAGVSSASVGDASVSYGASGAPGGGSSRISWSAETLRWRRRNA